jgi:integrase
MARHLLSARQVQAAGEGDHSDGDGLYLRVKSGGKLKDTTASWVFRYTAPSGKRREFGLGATDRSSQQVAGASLTRAREKAEDARKLLDEKPPRDPIDVKAAEREEARRKEADARAEKKSATTTLRKFARAYHAAHIEPIRADRHGQEWLKSIERHVGAQVLNTPIAAVTAIDLLDALVPVLRKVPDTGWRVYQRLGTVFDAAVIERLRPDNPAGPIRRELRKRAGRRDPGSHAAMPYREIPGFMSDLRLRKGNAARCLEFTILTAARTAEALMAEWSEFDLPQRTWTIPAAKMKGREQHVVYLCDCVIEILEGQAGQHTQFVFPSTAGNNRPMSNMAMLIQLQRMGLWGKKVTTQRVTVHGFRASFSTWANELAIARPDVVEVALAHNETDRVRRAYNRARFLAERQMLMVAWGNYCAGHPVTRADRTPVTDAAVIQFPAVQQVAA